MFHLHSVLLLILPLIQWPMARSPSCHPCLASFASARNLTPEGTWVRNWPDRGRIRSFVSSTTFPQTRVRTRTLLRTEWVTWCPGTRSCSRRFPWPRWRHRTTARTVGTFVRSEYSCTIRWWPGHGQRRRNKTFPELDASRKRSTWPSTRWRPEKRRIEGWTRSFRPSSSCRTFVRTSDWTRTVHCTFWSLPWRYRIRSRTRPLHNTVSTCGPLFWYNPVFRWSSFWRLLLFGKIGLNFVNCFVNCCAHLRNNCNSWCSPIGRTCSRRSFSN